jgi:kojibiose phosphorylase
MWTLTEDTFLPEKQNHQETIFTVGNGYLSIRGAFEEGFPGERRGAFVHGVFDDAPVVFTELANAPDWLPFLLYLDGERFSLDSGAIERYQRRLDLRSGVLTRTVRWVSPSGKRAEITLERFASLADEHCMLLRCQVVPDFEGQVEIRAGLNGCTDNEGLTHWHWVRQGEQAGAVYLHNRTRKTGIDFVTAMRLAGISGEVLRREAWDVDNAPAVSLRLAARPGQALAVEKYVAVATSRDGRDPLALALQHLAAIDSYQAAQAASARAWQFEWERSDIQIDGDDEAQIALRFSLFQLLIAAPRRDDRVNIGAKTLSGFGYRGHSFWDTEIFMLPLFTFTAPHIARNLLHYRYQRLPAARHKARANGYEGAQFPWESADTGEEVTPRWVPHFSDPTQLVRIWPGDIEIHISADIAYAAFQYWQLTADDAWMAEVGAELILDTARFWAARAEWNGALERYEYRDVIGPDEYHDHVDNNAFTNRMARWNLETALLIWDWLRQHAPARAADLGTRLDLSESRLAHWRLVAEKIYQPVTPDGLIEQFDGYFQRKAIDLAALEPRTVSAQVLFGIEGCNETQVLKQPDVLMLQYLLRSAYSDGQVRLNFDYYTPRTDHTYGSSLGPSIQAIMSCEVDRLDEAYEHFIRAARADLRNVRGNAEDGIHAASAGGVWQAVVFGFAGLQMLPDPAIPYRLCSWRTRPRLPRHWRRLAFKFYFQGQLQQVEVFPAAGSDPASPALPAKPALRGFIFDLDGVLTDTAEYHFRAWKRLADEEGLPFNREDNEALRGISRRESLLLLLKDRQLPEARLQELMERKNRYYLDFIKEITPADLLPGVKDLLQALRAAGYRVAIGSASKNSQEVVERLGIGSLLDAISDGYSVEQPKPAPDLFWHAAAQLGLAPAECAVVEDAAAGIEAARRGGFRTVGLGPPERVGAAEVVYPSLAVVTLADLQKALA